MADLSGQELATWLLTAKPEERGEYLSDLLTEDVMDRCRGAQRNYAYYVALRCGCDFNDAYAFSQTNRFVDKIGEDEEINGQLEKET